MNTYYETPINKVFQEAIKVKPVKSSRIVAGLFDGKQCVAAGFNKMKSDPFQKKYGTTENNIFIHAEIAAIKDLLKFNGGIDYIKRLTLIVVRAKKVNGKFVHGISKPCKGCQRAIVEFGIKNIVYYDGHQFIDTEGRKK